MSNNYPRVLIVSSSAFNPYAGTGVTLSNLFRYWPHDKLAMIHADRNFEPDQDLCSDYFRIGSQERRTLRTIAAVAPNHTTSARETYAAGREAPGRVSRKMRIFSTISSIVGDLEPLAPIRISSRLGRWIKEFKPDIIYSPISSITYMSFVQRLIRMTDAPLAVHIMDDWPSTKYRHGLLGPICRHIMDKQLRRLFARASARIAIGQAMCDEYALRYGYDFIPFSCPSNSGEWTRARARRNKTPGPFRVVYVGTINTKNRHCLELVADSVASLNEAGKAIEMQIYTFPPRADIYRPTLERPPCVTVHEAPGGQEQFRKLLYDADLLTIPLDFTRKSIERMRLSFFTKVPAYMSSGVPILFIGPPQISIVEQALRENWAHVVTENNRKAATKALLTLMDDPQLRNQLAGNAIRTASERHDSTIIRERFRNTLLSAAREVKT